MHAIIIFIILTSFHVMSVSLTCNLRGVDPNIEIKIADYKSYLRKYEKANKTIRSIKKMKCANSSHDLIFAHTWVGDDDIGFLTSHDKYQTLKNNLDVTKFNIPCVIATLHFKNACPITCKPGAAKFSECHLTCSSDDGASTFKLDGIYNMGHLENKKVNNTIDALIGLCKCQPPQQLYNWLSKKIKSRECIKIGMVK